MLAFFHLLVERIQRGFLGLVLEVQFFEHLGQSVQVQPGALSLQRLAAAVGFEHLAIQIVHTGALDFAGA